MADRTVTTRLVAKVTEYVSGLKAADRATKGVTEELVDAARAGKAMGVAGAVGAAQAAAAFRIAESAARKLDGQIDETTRSVRDLAREIAHAGDEAERAKLVEKLTAKRKELRDFLDLRKLVDSDGADEAGSRSGKRFLGSFRTAVSTGGRQISEALSEGLNAAPLQVKAAVAGLVIAGATAAAVPAAAVISGAVLAGLGGGAVAAGIAAAIQDPAIKAEGAALGASLKAELIDAGKAFRGPTLSAIRDIRGQVAGIGDDLEAAFAPSARFVLPLTRGFTGLVRNVIPGLATGIAAAEPVITVLERHLPRIGTALADAIESIAEHADNAAAAFETLLQIIEGTVRVGGAVIAWLTDAYDWVLKIQLAAGVTAQAFAGWVPFVGGTIADFNTATAAALATANAAKKASEDGGQGLAEGWLRAAGAAGEASEQFETLAEMIDRVTGEALDARAANRNLEASIDDAADAVKENGRTLDESTPKGRANAEALDAIAAAAKESAAKIKEQTGSEKLAAEATEKGRTAFIKAAVAMGLGSKEAKILADKLLGIPSPKPKVDLKTAQAKRDADRVQARIDAIHGKTVEIRIKPVAVAGQRSGVGGLGGLPQRWGGITEHAQAGLLREASLFTPQSPARFAFAEPATGGEAFIPRNGDTARSRAIAETVVRDWLGGQVLWQRPMTQTAAAPAASPAPSLTPAQSAAAIRAALIGLSVQLDGRTVGYIQGRQADLYARGG